jgi:hypothetical protein
VQLHQAIHHLDLEGCVARDRLPGHGLQATIASIVQLVPHQVVDQHIQGQDARVAVRLGLFDTQVLAPVGFEEGTHKHVDFG